MEEIKGLFTIIIVFLTLFLYKLVKYHMEMDVEDKHIHKAYGYFIIIIFSFHSLWKEIDLSCKKI